MIGSAKHKFKLEGWPKLARLVGTAGLVGLLAATTSACSSTGSEDAEEEVVDEEGGNEAAAVANEDAAPAESAAANDAEAEAAIANVNSGLATENTQTAEAGMNAGADSAEVDQISDIPPMESAEASNSAEAVPTEAALADAAAPAAEATAPAADATAPAAPAAIAGPGLPPGTNAVVYVGGERAAIYDAPNGREVGRLAHGDFVLASAEGEWAKTGDGRFIKSAELQVKPVGRKIVQSRWRSPRSGH
jgi:hypothetical protein